MFEHGVDAVYDMIEQFESTMQSVVNDMQQVSADKLGLDIRAGYKLWVNDECIICKKDTDRTLQYYGGFEYCDKESRKEVGDYVIYFADDGRVEECINHFNDLESVD